MKVACVESLIHRAKVRCMSGIVVSQSRVIDDLLDIRNATDRALIHLKTDLAMSLIRKLDCVESAEMIKIYDDIDACWQLDPVFRASTN